MTTGSRFAQNCAKCGACTTVCPVYRQTGREYHTGRGKLHLLSKLDPAEASATYAEILSHCLLCGACSQVCSRQLPVAELLAEARGELTRRAGRQVMLRALSGGLLSRPHLLKALAPMARRLKELRLPADSGLNLRLGLMPDQESAAAANQDNTSDTPATISSPAAQKPNITDHRVQSGVSEHGMPQVFSGCFATYIEPEITRSLLSLLTRTGPAPADTPSGQGCCGLAAYSCGQREQARRLARKNIAAYPGQNPIVVACASCAAHLRRYPELLADDPQWASRAENFAGRIREFSQLLSEQSPLSGSDAYRPLKQQVTDPGEQLPGSDEPATLKVLYHDPCHLRFGLQITRAPRQLLTGLPGLELLELPDGPQCCGHGGLFHLAHPESADGILQRVSEAARNLNPQVITTACTGCLLHWRQARRQGYHQARVVHLAVLLDRLTRGTGD